MGGYLNVCSRRTMLSLLFDGASLLSVAAQNLAVKTNALWWMTGTPNIGIEIPVIETQTFQLFYGINPWKSDVKSTTHWCLQPEFRYWLRQRWKGWFVGIHAMGGEFNVENKRLPLGIWKGLRDNRYSGWYVGGGISAGYQWKLSRHWNLEAAIGFGYNYVEYDQYKCLKCGELERSSSLNYVGPTKLALNIQYLF